MKKAVDLHYFHEWLSFPHVIRRPPRGPPPQENLSRSFSLNIKKGSMTMIIDLIT